jgi:hypothetical protein
MAAVQIMCARIGMVTGRGLAGNFKRRFPRWLLPVFIVALLAANTINIAADLAGMADAAEMLSGINAHWSVVVFAILISWATVRLLYHQIANVLRWLVLVLFAYPMTAFVVGADWGQVVRATLIPSMPHTRDEWSMLVAILGTTISPYLFFWQASEEVEEEKAAGQSALAKRRGATIKELQLRRYRCRRGNIFLESGHVLYHPDNRHHTQPPRRYPHRDNSPGRRSASTSRRQICRNPVHRRYCRRRISCDPDAGGISGIRLRGNAGMAPRTGQEVRTGMRVLRSHSALDRGRCRTGLRGHQPREGTLLDRCYQRIITSLPSRRNPGRRFGQEANAGPPSSRLGWIVVAITTVAMFAAGVAMFVV